MIIFLIRHGISIANEQHRIAGHTDVPLSNEGISQLYNLKSEKYYPEMEQIYSSDLQRATHTASILFNTEFDDLHLHPGLREIYFGQEENKKYDPQNTKAYFHNFMTNSILTGGENFSDFMNRVTYAWDEITRELNPVRSMNNDKSIAVVAHFGVIRAILIHLGIIQPEAMFSDSIPNGLGYKLLWSKAGLQGYSKLTSPFPIAVHTSR